MMQTGPVTPIKRQSRRKFLAASLALLAGGGARAAVPSARIQDLMPEFFQEYGWVASLPREVQAQRLAEGFFARHRALYQRAGVRKLDATAVGRWLQAVTPLMPDMRRTHRRLTGDFLKYTRTFLRRFADFDVRASPIYLMPSLLQFDAHLQPSNGELPLFFGLDGIVHFHGADANLSVLLCHEIFHCYQAQKNPAVMGSEQSPLFVGLWIEGGATWVSEIMNPEASRLDVLLNDAALAASSEEARRSACRMLLDKFDSLSDADSKPFFSAGWHGPWPARIGYLIGLDIARTLSSSMSLEEFVRLALPTMRTLYLECVKAMANGRAG
jgi:hypothetical protein